MPNFIGGDIKEILIQHPVIGDFRFQAKSNESFTLDPGGFRSNDDENMITGSSIFIDQINAVRWSIEGPVAVDLLSENEMVNLPLLSASPVLSIITMVHISGAIFKGSGKPVGDIKVDSNAANLPIKFAGSGILEKL